MTIKEIYDKYKLIATEQSLETEAVKFIISETCHFNMTDLILNYDKKLSIIEEKVLTDKLNEYLYEKIPSQYVVGHTYFYSRKFKVNPSVLIPRFDTEVVVEKALEEVKLFKEKKIKVIDVGTGSGCIAITMKKENPKLIVDAVDISSEALSVALENARLNKAKVKFIKSDLLTEVNDKYDMLISNPPYIALNDEVEEIVSENEPSIALFAEDDGMAYYQMILEQSAKVLKEKNIIVFEIPHNKKEKIIELIKSYYSMANIRIENDLAGHNRVAIVENM